MRYMELRMTILGKLIDRVQLNAGKVREEKYINGLKDNLRDKHHRLIQNLQTSPCFCIVVPTNDIP
jgi:hypothetical protein